MKTVAVAVFAAAVALSAGAASAAQLTYWDPAVPGFVTKEVNPAPAATVTAPAGPTVSYYDPGNSEFVQVPAGSGQMVITTHDAPAPSSGSGVWNPAGT